MEESGDGDKIQEMEIDDEDEEQPEESVKVSRDTGPYARCLKAGICGFAKLFGLTPEQFAENLFNGKHQFSLLLNTFIAGFQRVIKKVTKNAFNFLDQVSSLVFIALICLTCIHFIPVCPIEF
jgi:hypothetical protein